MLGHDQPVPDFGPMQGTRSQSVPDFGPMQLVPDFGLMQWARPSMWFICIVWYVVVWGSSLSFVLTVSVLVSGTSASRGKSSGWWHRTHHSFSFYPGSWFGSWFLYDMDMIQFSAQCFIIILRYIMYGFMIWHSDYGFWLCWKTKFLGRIFGSFQVGIRALVWGIRIHFRVYLNSN